MKCSFRQIFLLVAGLASILYMGSGEKLWAHGSGWSQERAFTVLLSFYYADQMPMAYSEVQIFSPADANIPYQKGRSDQNGFFAFKPDQPGVWSFSANDGQGHLSPGEVQISAGQLNQNLGSDESGQNQSELPLARGGASAEGPEPLKIILGLSLIANLALIFLWRKKPGNNKHSEIAA